MLKKIGQKNYNMAITHTTILVEVAFMALCLTCILVDILPGGKTEFCFYVLLVAIYNLNEM